MVATDGEASVARRPVNRRSVERPVCSVRKSLSAGSAPSAHSTVQAKPAARRARMSARTGTVAVRVGSTMAYHDGARMSGTGGMRPPSTASSARATLGRP